MKINDTCFRAAKLLLVSFSVKKSLKEYINFYIDNE